MPLKGYDDNTENTDVVNRETMKGTFLQDQLPDKILLTSSDWFEVTNSLKKKARSLGCNRY